jgi:hypothetical protein
VVHPSREPSESDDHAELELEEFVERADLNKHAVNNDLNQMGIISAGGCGCLTKKEGTFFKQQLPVRSIDRLECFGIRMVLGCCSIRFIMNAFTTGRDNPKIIRKSDRLEAAGSPTSSSHGIIL